MHQTGTAARLSHRPARVGGQADARRTEPDSLGAYVHRPTAFLLHYAGRRLLAHTAIALAVVAAVACAVCTQYSVKYLVDTLSDGTRDGRVWLSFALLVSLILCDNLLWRAAGWIASHTFVGVTGDVRSDLFRHLTGHSPGYFQERLPGMLSSRITATSNAVFTMENMFIWNVLPPCLASIGSILFLFTVGTGVTLGMLAVAIVLSLVIYRLAAMGQPLHLGFADRAAAVDGEMVDIIGNMPLVRAFGGLHREHRRFDETVGYEMDARRASLRYLEKLRLLHAVGAGIFTIALLAWAIQRWEVGGVSTGDVVLVCTLGFTILHATRDLALALVDVTQHMARLSEALSTILVPHEMQPHPQAEPLQQQRGAVEFDHVFFSYPGEHPVFESLSLRIEAGQRVGLVGASGGGKSTLLALLQRFYEVQDGRILIDGSVLDRITEDSLRQAIAVVPQDISLFHRTVLDNIRYGKPEASDEEVRVAADAACCRAFIEALPQGMQTIVGDRGVKLSGGQRQRIAIARALLKNAPILLLDEATSALDIDSEEEIRRALDKLMQGRTVIAVAHRISTLRNFDRVIVLDHGSVAQDGAPDQLMRSAGPYRAMVRREMLRLGRRA
ncbi:MAG TPA: ABC transporter ATP-binding protein [Burkholderiales bacterium]|jgi:ATP-binding cassette subfamily B protein|nr:ABC transporter ATP-binding protein [Burkholderiales bacterium]